MRPISRSAVRPGAVTRNIRLRRPPRCGVASPQVERTKSNGFDPDSYRMTVGEHLEELRIRLMLGLGVFFIVAIVCLGFGEHVTRFFLRPLEIAQIHTHQSQQIYYTEAAESFTVMIKASLIVAAAISSPWLLYQLWQFVVQRPRRTPSLRGIYAFVLPRVDRCCYRLHRRSTNRTSPRLSLAARVRSRERRRLHGPTTADAHRRATAAI